MYCVTWQRPYLSNLKHETFKNKEQAENFIERLNSISIYEFIIKPSIAKCGM